MSEPRTKTSKEQNMPNETEGDNVEFSMDELESLFNKSQQQETPPAQNDSTESDEQSKEKDVTETQAFAKRLRERTDKAVAEERERIAQSLGYKDYADMQKANERKMFEDKGLDPEEISPLVDELVKKKLESDPRMQELEQFKAKQVEEFAKRELAEISNLTGVKYESLEQLPQDVIDDWRKTGSLKKSYIALHGEELIVKARSTQQRGETTHLQSTGTNAPKPPTGRPLTDKEKQMYRFFNPGITEEQLNSKTIKD